MSTLFWVKLILLTIEGIKNAVTWQDQKAYQDRVERIKADPVSEWNRRFKRVPSDQHNPAEPELPADYSDAAFCHFLGRSPGTRRRGAIANVLRGRREAVPVVRFARTALEVAALKESYGLLPLGVPLRQTSGSAGYDLPSSINVIIRPGDQVLIPTGWRISIPTGFCGVVFPRSGWAMRARIDRRAGLIDEDYRGELGVLLTNEGSEEKHIQRGDRVAQLVIQPYVAADVVEVAEFTETTDRGSGGFGSTGGMSNDTSR